MPLPHVVRTLKYYSPYNYPLTFDEIYQRYVGPEPITREELKGNLDSAIQQGAILREESASRSDLLPVKGGPTFQGRLQEVALVPLQRGGPTLSEPLYFLPKNPTAPANRQRLYQISQPKLALAKKITRILKHLPWIKLVGLTGTLALEAADEGDDIDLIIVTSPSRMWLTRGVVTAFLLLTGKYRQPKKIENKICPNIYLDLTHLQLPPQKRSPYTAHELAHIKPLVNKNETYGNLLEANHWVSSFLPNLSRSDLEEAVLLTTVERLPLIPLHLPSLLSHLDSLAFRLQYRYMKSKITSEIVTRHQAFFHPEKRKSLAFDKVES